MKAVTHALIACLADGSPQMPATLCAHLDVSPTELERQFCELTALGLPVAGGPVDGYRLIRPLVLLDPARIEALLGPHHVRRLDGIDVFDEIPGTNAWLLDARPPAAGQTHVCLAEFQSAGRGRRGRAWQSPFAGGLCLSIARIFERPPPEFQALGLAAGVAFHDALRNQGIHNVSLKWPNDLVAGGEKLGGILTEMRSEPRGATRAVVGVGINVNLGDSRSTVRGPGGLGATDLYTLCGGKDADRNRLAVALVVACMDMFDQFQQHGWAPFRERWRRIDGLTGKRIRVLQDQEVFNGRAIGLDPHGALRVMGDDGERLFVAGDVSVRPESDPVA